MNRREFVKNFSVLTGVVSLNPTMIAYSEPAHEVPTWKTIQGDDWVPGWELGNSFDTPSCFDYDHPYVRAMIENVVIPDARRELKEYGLSEAPVSIRAAVPFSNFGYFGRKVAWYTSNVWQSQPITGLYPKFVHDYEGGFIDGGTILVETTDALL